MKVVINNYTYLFILICALCGYLKNIVIILTICFIHELGHLFFIKLFHYQIISIEILPFGGYTTIDQKINSNINKDLIIALGGILSELVLMLVIYIFRNHLHIITYQLFIKYNIILILFNLLPIIPLDGSKLCNLFLEKLFSYHLSYYLNIIISLVCLIIFLLVNYFRHFDNYFIITFLFYKIIMALKNYKYLKNRFLLERYLYNLPYQKIDNHTKDINDLKKNVFHYFKEDHHYIKEKDKIASFLKKES